MTPIATDLAIPVPGSRRITLPRLDSGRVCLSFDRKLRFFVNPGGGFPYDDVNGGGFNAEGRVVSGPPRLLRAEVG